MKKILFSFVGNQDPISQRTNEEGSILKCVRRCKPDFIYLFPTAEDPGILSSTEKNAGETKEWIKMAEEELDNDCSVFIRPMPLKNPTDYNEVIRVGWPMIDTVIKQQQEEVKFYLNSSSGTPQLKTMWLVWANAGKIPGATILQVSDPTYSKEADQVTEVSCGFLEEENLLRRTIDYLRRGLFLLASEQLQKLGKITAAGSRKERGMALSQLLEGYHYWDLIMYKEACEIIKLKSELYTNVADMGAFPGLLERQVKWIGWLEGNNSMETEHNLIDLYYNMVRRFRQKNYTDTLARFWRLWEGILYFRMRTKYGIEPINLSRSLNIEIAQKVKSSLGNSKMSRSKAIEALEKILQDKDFIQFNRDIEATDVSLRKLATARNDSITAHGMKPVNAEMAKKAISVAKKLLKEFLPNMSLIVDYPFSPEEVNRAVGTVLRNV